MFDAVDLMNVIKKASTEAVEASKPTTICFGKVISISPLKIQVEQKLTLTKTQLVLTRNVTDYEIKINDSQVTIHNSLKIGEKVGMVKQQGGQKYLVIDRVVNDI